MFTRPRFHGVITLWMSVNETDGLPLLHRVGTRLGIGFIISDVATLRLVGIP